MKSPSSALADVIESDSRLAYDIHEFVREGIDLETEAAEPKAEPFWKGLREQGTELWLDSGDIGAIEPLWNRHFCGMTTNNSLLNDEIQKALTTNGFSAAVNCSINLAQITAMLMPNRRAAARSCVWSRCGRKTVNVRMWQQR